MADPLQTFLDALETSQGSFEDRLFKTIEVAQRTRDRKKNEVINNVNLLPQLAGLIRDEDSLQNYENMSEELANKADRYSETAPYAPFVKGIASNIREDYDIYTSSMEIGSNIIDSPEFLDTQKEFIDLGNSIKNKTLEDGKTPKYEGTIDFLVKENDRINSIIGRIERASSKTQFRYNKNAKYTDQEIKDKLSSYQKRLSVAVQTAIGNGKITPPEAEFIMIGDIDTYKEKKKEKTKTLNYQYKSMDNAQRKISDQIRALQSKEFKNADKAVLKLFAQTFTQDLQADLEVDPTLDPELDAISPSQMIKDLEKKNKQIAIAKSRIMSSYEAWQGLPMFDSPNATKSETSDLLKNIMEDDGSNMNNVLNQNKDKISNKVKEKSNKLTYDTSMGDTIVARNKARLKKYKINMQELGDLQDEWSSENSGETFDKYLENIFRKAERWDNFDEDIKTMWKSLSNEDKAKYKTLANFKKNWKF